MQVRFASHASSDLLMTRFSRRTTALEAVLLSALGASVGAQTFDTKALLAQPSGAIQCRIVAPPAGDSSASVFEFADTEPPSESRRLRIGYDRAGSPIHATVTSIGRSDKQPQDWGLLMVNFTEKLGGRSRYSGPQVDTSDALTAADSAAKMPRGMYALSPREWQQVHDLSVWLWIRRCASGPPAQKG